MNNVTKELIAFLEHKLDKAERSLTHEGVSILDGAPGRGSGRYPLGSGANPGQHGSGDLLTRIEKLQKMGYTDAEVAEMLGIEGRSGKSSSARLRAVKSILKEERRSAAIAEATKLREQGLSYQAIAEKMGVTPQAVNKWRHKGTFLVIDNLYILSGMLGVSIDELIVPKAWKEQTFLVEVR